MATTTPRCREEEVRPGQSVPGEPEHQTDLLRHGCTTATSVQCVDDNVLITQPPCPLVKGKTMTAFSVVRFRVKPSREQEFLDAHRKIEAGWPASCMPA
jgi:hypothetical protein